jgi:hypothetical protein
MALTRLSCAQSDPANLAWKKLCPNTLQAIIGFVALPETHEFATDTLALTEATWDTGRKAVAASRFYFFPKAEDASPTPKEAEYKETKFEGSKFVNKNILAWEFTIDCHYTVAQKMLTHNGVLKRIALIDAAGTILLTSDDETKLRGFTPQMMDVQQLFSDGATGHRTKVKISLADSDEWNERGWAGTPTWSILTKEGLYDVVHTVTGILGTGITVSVITHNGSATDSRSQWVGLVAADFIILTSGGVPVAHTLSSDNGDGTYTLLATLANGTYTVGLAAPSAISVAAYGIESYATTSFTVSV